MASSRFHCRPVCKSEYEPDSLNRWRLLAKFVFVMCARIRFASDRDSSGVPVVFRNVKGILNACFRKFNCEGGLEVVPSLPMSVTSMMSSFSAINPALGVIGNE